MYFCVNIFTFIFLPCFYVVILKDIHDILQIIDDRKYKIDEHAILCYLNFAFSCFSCVIEWIIYTIEGKKCLFET